MTRFLSKSVVADCAICMVLLSLSVASSANDSLRVGMAEVDITPPIGFPMAGYYHERLAEGSIDPLKAKAIVFQEGTTQFALVVCDLIGIATDLKQAIRHRGAEKTGIAADHISISATHSHTAPDYMKELYLFLGNENRVPLRAQYIQKLIDGPVESIANAKANARPVKLSVGSAIQQTPVSFNRRAVMRDGSVRTWVGHDHPDYIRPAGPIDSNIELLAIRDDGGQLNGILSNFALHLDTVGGSKWSADYPFFIEQGLRKQFGPDLVSIFATGCCGDINHIDPRRHDRNKTDQIGYAIAESIQSQFNALRPVEKTKLSVRVRTVLLPLQDSTKDDVAKSIPILQTAAQQGKVDFFDHVTAYKKMILDHFRHKQPLANTIDYITWGLSRSLQGVGDKIPVDVVVATIGDDLAIVCLPGEVFVDLGLAIKRASPFRTTMVIELSNCVETIYIPHRAAYAGGSYEVTNSATEPGSGEVLVETALSLLREAASTKE